MSKHSYFAVLALGLVVGSLSASSEPMDEASMAKSVVVPVKIEEVYGQRPVVQVDFNGHPFDMVVHSNAGFFMQINHALAKTIGVRDVRHVGSYGIESIGHVSALGRDEAYFDHFGVGGVKYDNQPVSVFETPVADSTGMLGIGWIQRNRVVLDYAAREMTLNPGPGETKVLRDRLLHSGYTAVPMLRDDALKRYTVRVRIGGAVEPMTVSTVATVSLDKDFALKAGIEQGDVLETHGGPKGVTVNAYGTRKPFTITIGTWRSAPLSDALIEDTYAYMSQVRPTSGASGGQLGADFLIRNKAVVDFGNNMLYLLNVKE